MIVNNPGHARVRNAVITIKGSFGVPSGILITNNTTGYQIQSVSSGVASSDWLRFDAGKNSAKISHDSGSTWTDDYVNFRRAVDQVGLMVLAPGDNNFTVVGADSADAAEIEFLRTYDG